MHSQWPDGLPRPLRAGEHPSRRGFCPSPSWFAQPAYPPSQRWFPHHYLGSELGVQRRGPGNLSGLLRTGACLRTQGFCPLSRF